MVNIRYNINKLIIIPIHNLGINMLDADLYARIVRQEDYLVYEKAAKSGPNSRLYILSTGKF